MTEQFVAVRVDSQPGTTLPNRPGSLSQIELRQHVRDLPAHPCPTRRGDDDVPLIGQRSEGDVVVMRQHRDLVLRGIQIALEHQILHRALEARHLLGQAFTAILLRRALGLRHVIEEIHRAERGGKAQQDKRNRELERGRDAQVHFNSSASGPGARTPSMSSPGRSNLASTIKARSRRPVTDNSGVAPPSIFRFSSRDGT